MIRIWTDGAEAGFLDRLGERGTAFAYSPGIAPARGVSVTMPVRLPSYNLPFGLAPIFEMSLPEGALRDRLRLTFAKATGTFDDFDLLAIVGRSQIGRIRYTGESQALDEEVPFQSVDEILSARRNADLYRYLLDKFATYSGVSGVQPKVLVRDETESIQRVSPSYKGATHIVKFWEANEFPQLAANENFCLKVAERCGLTVPRYRLSEDGLALVVDRFDLRNEGTYRGFEDFCVLNARSAAEKYRGSYETSILKRFQQFGTATTVMKDLENLFTMVALNCALRNGDAHLKNFGILYDDVLGEVRLAPTYDLVTTTAYLPNDAMALTLNGTTRWPTLKELRRLGETRATLTPARVRGILERIADALSETAAELRVYIASHSEFTDIGGRMLTIWEASASEFHHG
jgi:serine/threonine-protein kinase HipA